MYLNQTSFWITSIFYICIDIAEEIGGKHDVSLGDQWIYLCCGRLSKLFYIRVTIFFTVSPVVRMYTGILQFSRHYATASASVVSVITSTFDVYVDIDEKIDSREARFAQCINWVSQIGKNIYFSKCGLFMNEVVVNFF